MEQSPAALRIHLLGRFLVERGGAAVPRPAWKRRDAMSLIKVLALSHPRPVHRDQVLETLWSESSLSVAVNHLRKASHAARHTLEPELQPWAHSAHLLFEDDLLSLQGDVWIDAAEFERLASIALRSSAMDDLERALAAYGGELLPADRYEDWTATRRDALARRHVQLLGQSASWLEAAGKYSEAVERLQLALEHEPTREDAHRGLMRLFLLMGMRREAVAQYHACRMALREELDTVPDERTEALVRQVGPDQTSEQFGPGTKGDRLRGPASWFPP